MEGQLVRIGESGLPQGRAAEGAGPGWLRVLSVSCAGSLRSYFSFCFEFRERESKKDFVLLSTKVRVDYCKMYLSCLFSFKKILFI